MIANFEATDNDFIDLRTLGKLQRKEVIAVKKDWRAKKLPKKLLIDQKVQERLYRWPSYEYFIDHSDLKLGLLHSLLNYLTICLFFFFRVSGPACAHSTNLTGPEINDHVSLQWPSYEQPQGSNLRPQRKQTSLSQVLTTGPPSKWLTIYFTTSNYMLYITCREWLSCLLCITTYLSYFNGFRRKHQTINSKTYFYNGRATSPILFAIL
jgi:hypothetical protein